MDDRTPIAAEYRNSPLSDVWFQCMNPLSIEQIERYNRNIGWARIRVAGEE